MTMARRAKFPKGRKVIVDNDYIELVRKFPLRLLRDDQDQDEAVKTLSGIVGRIGSKLTTGEREYADALGCIVREHDNRVYPRGKTK